MSSCAEVCGDQHPQPDAGVLVFAGLTAYDTQKLREHHASMGHKSRGSAAITGALILYLDFINLFLMLLRLLGNRR